MQANRILRKNHKHFYDFRNSFDSEVMTHNLWVINNDSLVSDWVLTDFFFLWNFPIFKITMTSFMIFTSVIRLTMMLTNLNSFYWTIWWFQTLFSFNILLLKWLWLTCNWKNDRQRSCFQLEKLLELPIIWKKTKSVGTTHLFQKLCLVASIFQFSLRHFFFLQMTDCPSLFKLF